MARDSGLGLIFAILDLIIEIADDSSKVNRKSGYSLFGPKTSRIHRASSMNALMKLEQQKQENANPKQVYEPMTGKPVKTVSSTDRMAAFAAIKSGKTMTKQKPEPVSRADAFDAISNENAKKQSLNPISTTAKQVKLEILLLGYMFQEDDGRISGKEKRAIKKHYKTYQNKLTTEDIKDIKDMSGMDNSLMNIRAFLSQQKVSDTTITNSIRTLKEINREGDRYNSIIERIERSLLDSMGY